MQIKITKDEEKPVKQYLRRILSVSNIPAATYLKKLN